MALNASEARTPWRHLLSVGLFVQFPALAAGWLCWIAVRGSTWFDDLFIFRTAGRAVLHGHSPYVAPHAALFVHSDRFVYPAPFALPFIPFALMPATVAKIVFLLVSFAALGLALWLLEVRDPRCYGLALLTPPVIGALGVGSFGPFLVLLLAAGWRYRDRAVAGVVLALVAAAKLFLWPVLIWLLVTRRIRATAASVGTLAALGLVWALMDLHGLREYPATLHALNAVQRWRSYSPQSFVLSVGLGTTAAATAGIVLTLAGLAAIFVLARMPTGDQLAFGASIGVALLATPILWEHYLILLLVPIALAAPRLSQLWLVTLGFWISPFPKALGSTWKIAVVLALTTVILAAASDLLPHLRVASRRPEDAARRAVASQSA
jgi:alpha-1,2-mannosyltransferase